jgi:glutathione S-transferase
MVRNPEARLMTKLYFSPGACSMAAHVVLEEIGKPFEAVPVLTRKGEQKSGAYTAINWKQKVPTLEVDGRRLTENVAILSFLGWSAPEAKLMPAAGTWAATEALSLLAWFASGVHPVIGRFFRPSALCDLPGSEDSVKRIAGEQTAAAFAGIERMLEGRDWFLGDYSVADPYAFVFMHWAKGPLKLDVSAYPNYVAHYERVVARPAAQRMLAREAAATPAA